MNIILLGPQGSGKSTQAKNLAQFLNLPYFSMGERIKEINNDSSNPLRKLIKTDFESGKLVSNSVVNKILGDSLEKFVLRGGFVADGTPRNLNQAMFIDELLAIHNKKIDLAVFIDTSIDECKKRILKRIGVEHRVDDTPAAVEERLNIYFSTTQKILDIYKNRGVLLTINGNPGPEEVWSSLKSEVSLYFNLNQ